MGIGELIAARAEAQVHATEIENERTELGLSPAFEQDELAQFFVYEGVEPDDAVSLAAILVKYPEAYAKTMVEKELGVRFVSATVRIPESLTMALSYAIASIFPLIAYFFLPIPQALPLSLVLTCLALIVVGAIKGKLASLRLLPSVLEIVGVGALSGIGGYVLGSLVPHIFFMAAH